MAAEHPVTDLMNDHRLIERVMTALEARLKPGEAPEFPIEFVEQALAFFVEFADGCHHYKEEEALFPALAELGVPVEGGPIGIMLFEHTVGRKCLAGIRGNLEAARAGDEAAQSAVRGQAEQYISLLRQHIWKEDNILFRMAERALDPDAAAEMLSRFRDEGNLRTSKAAQEKHLAFAAAL